MNLKNSGFLVLVCILIFSPIIATSNPDMQTNLSLNSLKPPMQKVVHFSRCKSQANLLEHFKFYNELFFNTYETDDNKTCLSVEENSKSFLLQMDNSVEEIVKNDNFNYSVSSLIFLFGTDELGRDIFSRLLYGTRFSIFIGASSVVIAFFVGTLIGFICGYFESGWDNFFNHVIDLFLAFPILFLIILLVSLFDNSVFLIVLILGLSGWMSLAKLVRGEVIEIKKQDFITTSIQLGYSKSELLVKEFFPNLLGPVIVNLVFLFVNIVLVESALSFLGLGVQDLYPTWGGMIQEGQEYMQNAWWISLFPALALIFVLLYINHLGQQLKLKFDPKVEV